MQSIRTTLLVSYAAILILVIGGFALGLFLLERHAGYRRVDTGLETHALAVAGSMEWDENEGFELELGGPYEGFFRQTGPDAPYLVVRDAHGLTLLSTPATPASDSALLPRREVRASGPFGTEILVGHGVQSLVKEQAEFAWMLALVGLAAFLAAFLAGFLLVRRVLKPIARMTETATRISGTNRQERIDVGRTESELGRLASTLNGAFDRMDAAVEEQARFLADASHELRTPLATIDVASAWALRRERSNDELREGLVIGQRATSRMRGIVENMLALARADAGAQIVVREPVDLADVAREEVRHVAGLAEAQDTRLDIEVECAPAWGDGDALGRALGALLDNALTHGGPGGTIRIRTGLDDHAWLEVEDAGPGIDPEHVGNVFERFYRGDSSRSAATGGSGLGLALARSLVEAQGGTIQIQATGPEGTTFRVELVALERAHDGSPVPTRHPATDENSLHWSPVDEEA